MKKTIFIILLSFCFCNIYAQGHFEPQVRVTFDAGVDFNKNLSFGADFVAGYRLNPKVRLGAGVGISYIDLNYQPVSLSTSKYKESAAYVPVFADVKFNFNENKYSPFFIFDLGYSIFIPFSKFAEENKLGLYFAPAIGCDFNFGSGIMFAQVGYKYQMRDYKDFKSPNYNQVTVGIGYQF